MKYNTGKASYRIGEDEKDAFRKAHARNRPSEAQKRMWKMLMAKLKENNLTMQGMGFFRLDTKEDYAIAIDEVIKILIRHGLWEKREPKTYKRRGQEWFKKMQEERRNTAWISLKQKLPDRKYVKTLDEDGNMNTLEWNAEYKVFVSEYGKPVTKKNERVHRYKVPIAWAYLEDWKK